MDQESAGNKKRKASDEGDEERTVSKSQKGGEKTRSSITVGMSGYSYSEWRGTFYPPGVSSRKNLEYYAEQFDAVELNATFYRTMKESTWEQWAERVDNSNKEFIFAVKANKAFTHFRQLQCDDKFRERWKSFWERCELLGRHLGPVLFQFPEKFTKNEETMANLRQVLEMLEETSKQAQNVSAKFVLEFRHESWFCGEVYDLIDSFASVGLAQVHVHTSSKQPWAPLKSGWYPSPENNNGRMRPCCTWGCYVRLHGWTGQYKGSYPSDFLDELVNSIKQISPQETFIFFNNTGPKEGVENARYIQSILQGDK